MPDYLPRLLLFASVGYFVQFRQFYLLYVLYVTICAFSNRWHKDVARTKKGTLMFLPHFDIFFDLSVYNGNIKSICFVYKKISKRTFYDVISSLGLSCS